MNKNSVYRNLNL